MSIWRYSCLLIWVPLCLPIRSSTSCSSPFVPRLMQIQMEPCNVVFENVYKAYPNHWQRVLFSSVPRRDYALQNVSFTWSTGSIILLTGESSSGKSTVFKLASGRETVSEGCVHLSTMINDGQERAEATLLPPARPIYLDDLPLRHDGRTMAELLQETFQHNNICDLLQQQSMSMYFLNLVGLLDLPHQSVDHSMGHFPQCRLNQLSPSEIYRFQLVLASLESILSSTGNQLKVVSTTEARGLSQRLVLPAPILLLDEWLDRETTAIVSKVIQKALVPLAIQAGAVVAAITHRPERWVHEPKQISRMALSRGKIIHSDISHTSRMKS